MLKLLVKRHAWAIFCLLSAMYFVSRPSGLGQLLVMLASVAALAAILQFVWIAITLRKHKDASKLVTPSLVIVGFGLGLFLGSNFREWNFNHNLASYNKAAIWASARARNDEIVVLKLPQEFSSLGRLAHVHKNARCGLMIDFFWGGGFPVKHIVRRFAERPGFTDIPECRESWSRGRQLADNWFELRD